MFFFFFVFKQKTAYEMRISDWSSDVCSSDLCRMVAEGITRARLPADNPVRCSLGDPRTQALARRLGTTRSAAAVDLWGDDLAGAVVAIGNAPTALYRLDRQSVV